jgi:hypothetical protein
LVISLGAFAVLIAGIPQLRSERTARAAAPEKKLASPSLARELNLRVWSDNARVLVQWDAPMRSGVVGYNLYRESRGRYTLLNATPIAGRALQFNAEGTAGAAGGYAWWDSAWPGMGGVRYWVDEVSLENETVRFGPVAPSLTQLDAVSWTQSKTLGDLDKALNDNGVSTELSRPSASGELRGNLNLRGPKAEGVSPLQQQWLIASGPALKIAVDREGWQKIPLADMQAAGIPTSNPNNYKLFADGIEQSIRANGDGSLEFYGRGLNIESTTSRIYWLTSGAGGHRVQQLNQGAFDAGVTAGSYSATVERRDRIVRFSSLTNGPGNNWFGPVILSSQVRQSLPVSSLDTAGPVGQLDVVVQGLTTVGHSVEVRLNGSLLGTINFSSLGSGTGQYPVPMALLQNGKNLVTLASTGVGDINLTDYVRLTYSRRNRANADRFRYDVPAGQALRVDGFSSSQIRVFDITDPVNPSELIVGTAGDGNGGFAFTLPAGPARTIVAQTAAVANNYFARLSANTASMLNLTSNQADFVILAPSAWGSAAEPLRALRQSQGLNSRIVAIEDVYDEFSFGAHDPQAITDFAQRASTVWATPVRYVLLFGDATNDPRDYLGTQGAAADPIPTRLVNSQFTESASDDTLTDFNSDGIADVPVGRLPAKNATQAAQLIAKVIQQDGQPVGDVVARGALMVIDSNVDYNFEDFNAQIEQSLPMGINIQRIDRDDGTPTQVHDSLVAAINTGKGLVNFMGHGNVTAWTGAGILTNTDPATFTNANRYSIFVMLTCLNGSFTDTNSDCLAEEVIRSPGGGVAVWASSGETFPFGQVILNGRLYQNIFPPSSMRLGDAVKEAKSHTDDADVRHLSILFGDPTMPVR